MEFLKCKACGSISMVPVDVRLTDGDDDEPDTDDLSGFLSDAAETSLPDAGNDDSDEESRFYSCHVCGDNWLSIRRQDDEGDSRVTFIHQMGVHPVLRRVAHLQQDLVINESAVDRWEYYLDDDEVEEVEWHDKLADRRKVLKAICSN